MPNSNGGVSYLKIWQLAWPVIVSNITVPLVGIVDTAVMGQLHDPRYISAIAVGSVIFASLFGTFNFLRMSTTGFVAQASGADNQQAVDDILMRGLQIGLLIGMLLVIFQYPLGLLAFWMVDAGDEIREVAETYYTIRIYSAPAVLLNFCVLGVLIGQQRMRAALVLQLLLNCCNLVLDVVLVLGFEMAAAGVAIASVVSEYLALAVGLWLLRSLWLPAFRASRFSGFLADGAAYKELLRVNSDLFARTMMLNAAFFIFTAQSAQFGAITLAANAILLNLLHLLAYGLDGFAIAAEALAGNAWGAKSASRFRETVDKSTRLAFVMALLISGLILLFGPLMISGMSINQEVVAVANHYLPWIIAAPLIAVLSYQMDGVFVGAMQTRLMRNTVGLSLLLYCIVSNALSGWLGNNALWLAMMIFLLARGITLYRAYSRRLIAELETTQ